jgi:hypothetical protein
LGTFSCILGKWESGGSLLFGMGARKDVLMLPGSIRDDYSRRKQTFMRWWKPYRSVHTVLRRSSRPNVSSVVQTPPIALAITINLMYSLGGESIGDVMYKGFLRVTIHEKVKRRVPSAEPEGLELPFQEPESRSRVMYKGSFNVSRDLEDLKGEYPFPKPGSRATFPRRRTRRGYYVQRKDFQYVTIFQSLKKQIHSSTPGV